MAGLSARALRDTKVLERAATLCGRRDVMSGAIYILLLMSPGKNEMSTATGAAPKPKEVFVVAWLWSPGGKEKWINESP